MPVVCERGDRVVISHTEKPRLQQVITILVFESQLEPGGSVSGPGSRNATGRPIAARIRNPVSCCTARRHAFVPGGHCCQRISVNDQLMLLELTISTCAATGD